MADAVNATNIKIASDGAWQGESPIKFAFPLLIVQITLVLLVSRTLTFLLKPFRQPNVVAEILGGIILGPSVLGRWKTYMMIVFPSWSSPILETVSSIGLLFFLFLVGLELDINSICRSSRKAFGIAAAGILLPFLSGIGIVFLLRKTVSGVHEVGFYQFLVFIGVALSITAFPVLARILAELKLLTTSVGETAMAAAAFNDVAAWVLLALAVALSGGQHRSPLVPIWILLSGIVFVVFMMIAVRPLMAWIARRSSVENRAISEACICMTLAGVLVSGLLTDVIGIHSIFGALMFGLTIPKEGKFAERLFERIESFVSGLMLPLYFASSGLKTDVAKIHGLQDWGLLAIVIAAACIGKIAGTFMVAVSNKIPAREAATLGVLMGTKGLVELIVLNIGKEKKVLNEETFTILVLMALITTFMTTPIVLAIYKPTEVQRLQLDSSSSSGRKNLRILACYNSSSNIPAIINLIEMIKGTCGNSTVKLYMMQLLELTELPSSIFTALRTRRNGRSANGSTKMQACRELGAFKFYRKLDKVKIRPMTTISALVTMHVDVCHVAEEKRVAFVILPFHKHWTGEGDDEVEDVGRKWGEVNRRVLANAPCSVGVLIDRGFGGPFISEPLTNFCGVCVLFFGGPDDRKALEFGAMMRYNPSVVLTVIQFVKDNSDCMSDQEREEDEEAIKEFKRSDEPTVTYEERRDTNVVEDVLDVGRKREYNLVVVGRRWDSTKAEAAGTRNGWGKHIELGPVGNILASQDHELVSSVLVIQYHGTSNSSTLAHLSSVNGSPLMPVVRPNISTSV